MRHLLDGHPRLSIGSPLMDGGDGDFGDGESSGCFLPWRARSPVAYIAATWAIGGYLPSCPSCHGGCAEAAAQVLALSTLLRRFGLAKRFTSVMGLYGPFTFVVSRYGMRLHFTCPWVDMIVFFFYRESVWEYTLRLGRFRRRESGSNNGNHWYTRL